VIKLFSNIWKILRNKPIINEYGTQRWYSIKNQLHKKNGPAVIYANGTQEWWINERRHRIDGPAYIRSDGYQEWYRNGEWHRTDGPAVTYYDGTQTWFIDGTLYFNNKSFQKAANLSDEDMLTMILKYGNVE
jgi:hypothetical protein